jgi:ATP-dependent exoDNAse (exonuclease V) beta subunit
MDRLGQALHLCLAKATAQGALTQADIAHALNTWAVSQAVDTAEVLEQLQAFEAWCQQQWPGAARLAEVPIEAPGPQGTRIHGRIDYLLRTPQGWVLIDHKANPRGSAGDDALARTYGPQLSTYAQAILAATGVPVLQAWLYQPVAGRAVRLAGDHLP